MATRLSKYQVSAKKYNARRHTFVKNDKTAKEVFDALSIAQNKYMRSSRVESANYDPIWLNNIEGCIPELGEIIKNPRKVTKTVTSIVPIELAKKTNDESVRHLASHSQYVKNVDEMGNITPNKILNIASDDDYLTYENKFIATLIKRLMIFIEKRYEYITKFGPLKQVDSLFYKTKAVVDGSIVEIETKVKVSKSIDEKEAERNDNYIKRIERVRTYILYYYASDFMKMFKHERDVKSPILQTNIIRKNPLYRKCYQLFKYIENYTQLGIDYKVQETYQNLTDADLKTLDEMAVGNFLSLKPDRPTNFPLARSKVYKPRILKTCDDDPFFYGPLQHGNIEFLRVDDKYFEELEKTNEVLPEHMTKVEKEYHAEDIAKKKELEKQKKLAKALKARREKEEKEFEKQQKLLIEEEKKRLAKLKAEEEARKKKEEENRIAVARKDLKQEALTDKIEVEIKKRNEEEIEKARQALLEESKKQEASEQENENKDK